MEDSVVDVLFTLVFLAVLIFIGVKVFKSSKARKILGWVLLLNMVVSGIPSLLVMVVALFEESGETFLEQPVFLLMMILLLLLIAIFYIDVIIMVFWMVKGKLRLPLLLNWCWGLISLPYYLYYRSRDKGKGCVCSWCNTKFRLPVYGCDNDNGIASCQKRHKRLEPRFGKIKSAPCTCGNSLPRTDTMKVSWRSISARTRTALPAYCPNCGEQLDEFTAERLKHASVVILGTANETRRRFRQGFIYYFINSEAQKLGMKVKCSDRHYDNHTSSVAERSSIESQFPRGMIQQKESFEFKFTVTHGKKKAMLHIYTPEQSDVQWNSRKAKAFNISEKNGAILVLRGDVVGCQELDTEARRLLDALQQTTDMKKSGGKYAIPLVIAIENTAGLIDEKRGNAACRDFIVNQTQTGSNALVLLEHNFADVRFCAYSSDTSAAQIVKQMLWE